MCSKYKLFVKTQAAAAAAAGAGAAARKRTPRVWAKKRQI